LAKTGSQIYAKCYPKKIKKVLAPDLTNGIIERVAGETLHGDL